MSAVMRQGPCISDLAFDEWLAGDGSRAVRDELDAHLASCVRCRIRHDLLAGERGAFLQRAPDWQQFLAGRRGAPAQSRTVGAKPVFAGIALAASLLLAFFALDDTEPSYRSKGGPRIGAYVKRNGIVTRAQQGERVQPGDQLRFVYSSPAPIFFALLHRDARDATVYYPLAARSARVDGGKDVALDFGIKLDDVPGVEAVQGVFCSEPVLLEPLRSALAKTGSVPELPNCTVDVLELNKVDVHE